MQNHNDLILIIVNRGYSDVVMEAARAAGAKGGTILHGRGTSAIDIEKFFNIKLQEEKEIIMIAAQHEAKNAIMDAVMHAAGLASDAHGVVFTLPLEEFVVLKEMQS